MQALSCLAFLNSSAVENSRILGLRRRLIGKSLSCWPPVCPTNGLVKGMFLAPGIHEHFTMHKWLRQTAYIFMHKFNNIEHIANNCMSAMTHTDVTTAHTEHDARRLDVLSDMRSYFTLAQVSSVCLRSIHGHRHAHLFLSVLLLVSLSLSTSSSSPTSTSS